MRFQYRLRTLFIVVTLVAVACAWIGHEYRIVQERKALNEWARENFGLAGGGRYNESPTVP